MTRRSDAGEAQNRGFFVSSSQCLNTKCGRGGGGGGGGGAGGGEVTQGYYWYGCASLYLDTNPNHISGPFFFFFF